MESESDSSPFGLNRIPNLTSRGDFYIAHQLTYQTSLGDCKRFNNSFWLAFNRFAALNESFRRLVQNIRNSGTPQAPAGDLLVENTNNGRKD